MYKLSVALAFASLAFGQHESAGASPEPKPAEQVFKNIVELKGTQADQLMPAMQFITASLGVDCEFCHVPGKFDADDKEEKKTARAMIAMQNSINKTSFNGRLEVTCNTCHRGASHPAGLPRVLDADSPATHTHGAAAGGSAPTVDQVLDKYVAAMGGAEAIHKVTSRTMKGSLLAGGNQTPIEVLTKAPNKRVSISHGANGDSFTSFDGTAGWLGSTGRPAHDMSAVESGAASIDAEFYLALRVKELFPQLRRGRAETIDGVDCDVLIGSAPGKPAVRLYFDKATGLLKRQVRLAETPLGRNPTQIDYADYKAVDGVTIPLRWTLSRTNGRFTIQIAEVKSNEPLDDARFAKPASQ